MNARIIVDSTTDLLAEQEAQVSIVPLTVCFGNEEYIDGITINHEEFYRKLTGSDILPTTSQATPDAFMKAFEEVKEAGDSAVVITLSSTFSGTYQSAIIAAEEYDNIYVVDSGSATMGSGILVEYALELQRQGLGAKEIAEQLEEEKKRIKIVALVDTLEYLKKGGRVSKSVAFAGAVLNIKPILGVANGDIQMLGKARGTKLGNKLLIQEIENVGGIDFSKPVLFGYSGTSDEALLKFIEESKCLWKKEMETVRHTSIGSVIGTHVGPGAVAVAFYEKK